MRKFILVLLLFFVFSFLLRNDFSFDQDLGRHIKLGEIILQTKNVLLVNLFSYTYPDFPFINSHWLFEVLVALGNKYIGLQFLLFSKIIIMLTAIWLALAVCPKKNYLFLPIGFIFLHLLRERLDLRPEIISFFFTALTIFILNKFEKINTRLIFALPIIQLIWINSHIYFLVGLVIQAIYIIHLGFNKNKKVKLLVLIFILSLSFSFINPSGYKAILNPFLYSSNYGYTIVENQTMFLLESINFTDRNFLFVKLALAIIALSILIGYKRRTLNLLNLLLLTFGTTLALLNVRSFPYLIFICLPPVLENIGPVKLNSFFKALTILTVALLISESFLYLNGNYYKYTDRPEQVSLSLPQSGKGAMDFVLTNNLPTPIFNNFDIGSYITYRGYPTYKVFVDGRPGEYPKEFFSQEYIPMQTDQNLFEKEEKKYGFKTIIFSHTDQTPWGKAFLSSISKDPKWNLVYIDDSWVLYVKKDIASLLNLKVIDLATLDPSSFNYNNHFSYLKIASFLINTNNIKTANAFLDKALTIFPDSPIANGIKGQILLSTGDLLNQSLAQQHLQKSKNIFFW